MPQSPAQPRQLARVSPACLQLIHLSKRPSLPTYVQRYSSFTEVFTAGNTYPFSNGNLSNLALSDDAVQMLQHVGKGTSINPGILVPCFTGKPSQIWLDQMKPCREPDQEAANQFLAHLYFTTWAWGQCDYGAIRI